jgi:hypothetical protein
MRAVKRAKRSFMPPFAIFAHIFLNVEGRGKEGKVHVDLVFSKMSEAAVCHVVLHLSEDRLWLYASLSAVPDALFRFESLAGLLLITVEPVIDFYDPPVGRGLVASAAQWTSAAVLRSVFCDLGDISAIRPAVFRAYTLHVLSHGADVVVFLPVVIHPLLGEGVGLVSGTVFKVEEIGRAHV